jgi:hypothetical protein
VKYLFDPFTGRQAAQAITHGTSEHLRDS